MAIVVRDYARAAARLADGLAYTRERDLDSARLYKLAMGARMHLEQGLWQKAEDEAGTVIEAGPTVARVIAVTVLGCVHTRRGDAEAQPRLDEARELALSTGDIQRIGPMAAARAEAAWLAGDMEKVREELSGAYALALKHPEPWRLGELSLWMRRAGAPDRPRVAIASPYEREIAGDWQGAAAVWQRIGCPYEQALALAGGDREAQLQALEILDRLGAAPAAQLIRRKMRAKGKRGVPLGPRIATKGNPLGLTTRQIEILRLLGANLSNKEIAIRLRISPKTVDHHLVTLFAKLGVSTRKEASMHPIGAALLAELDGESEASD